MNCPKCKLQLKVISREGAEVDLCPSCEGVWVEHVEQKHIIRYKPEALTIDDIRILRSQYEPYGKVEEVRYVPCPVCANLMNRMNWGRHSGVIVDRCREHGTWYDKGELEKVQEFVVKGGLEYEKHRFAEKGLADTQDHFRKHIERLDRRTLLGDRMRYLWWLLG